MAFPDERYTPRLPGRPDSFRVEPFVLSSFPTFFSARATASLAWLDRPAVLPSGPVGTIRVCRGPRLKAKGALFFRKMYALPFCGDAQSAENAVLFVGKMYALPSSEECLANNGQPFLFTKMYALPFWASRSFPDRRGAAGGIRGRSGRDDARVAGNAAGGGGSLECFGKSSIHSTPFPASGGRYGESRCCRLWCHRPETR